MLGFFFCYCVHCVVVFILFIILLFLLLFCCFFFLFWFFFFFKQKTAYEMRISDWSSDVCSSDLKVLEGPALASRLFISQSRGYPICVSSVVKYAPEEERLKRHRQQHGDELAQEFSLPQRDWRGFSYVQQIGRASCRERVCQYV